MPYRVLIIDDDEFVREVLAQHCKMLDLASVCASTGEEGLHILGREPIDLVITDIMMPGMNGEAVVRHIKRTPALESIPVLVVSGYANTDVIVRCIELGAEDILHKPFEAIVLQARIKSCLERRELRNKAMRAAEEQAREKATTAMIGGLCHHFSQPLTVMTANLHMINESIKRMDAGNQAAGGVNCDASHFNIQLVAAIKESVRGMKDALAEISNLVREVRTITRPVEEPYLQDKLIVNVKESAKKIVVLAARERLARTLYSKKLAQEGYRVIEATSPGEIMEHVGFAKPDLVILEVTMAGVDEIARARQARELSFPVILFSSHSVHENQISRADWVKGCDGFVSDLAPVSVSMLIECCAMVINSSGNRPAQTAL